MANPQAVEAAERETGLESKSRVVEDAAAAEDADLPPAQSRRRPPSMQSAKPHGLRRARLAMGVEKVERQSLLRHSGGGMDVDMRRVEVGEPNSAARCKSQQRR